MTRRKVVEKERTTFTQIDHDQEKERVGRRRERECERTRSRNETGLLWCTMFSYHSMHINDPESPIHNTIVGVHMCKSLCIYMYLI